MSSRVHRVASTRFRELDGFRGLAAIAVVLSHYTWAYDTRYVDGGRPLFRFGDGAYGVQLFFLISGFVILMTAQRASRPSDFVISRASRLYPAYWLALAITTSLATVFAVPHVPHDVRTVLWNLTMVQRWFLIPNVDEVYWTLAIEMEFYVLIFILLAATHARLTTRVIERVFALWLAVSASVALWAYPSSHGVDPQLVATPVKIVLNVVIAEYAPLFVGGAFLFLSRQRGALHPMVLGAWLTAAWNTYLLRDLAHAMVVCAIYLVFTLVAMRPSTRLLTCGPLQWLGKISYSLYITHATIGYVIIHLLVPTVGRNAAMLVALAAALSLAWIVWKIAEDTLSPLARRALMGVRAG